MKKFPDIPSVKKTVRSDGYSDRHWSIFLHYASSLSEKELQELFALLIPKGRQKDILKHFIGIKRIMDGAGYYQIHNELGLSHQTINLLRKSLKNSNYKSYNQIFGSSGERARAKRLKSIAREDRKPEPKLYKRTKYGKVRTNF